MCLRIHSVHRSTKPSCPATGPRLGMLRVTTLSVSKYLQQSQEHLISILTTHRCVCPCTARLHQVQTTSGSTCRLTG